MSGTPGACILRSWGGQEPGERETAGGKIAQLLHVPLQVRQRNDSPPTTPPDRRVSLLQWASPYKPPAPPAARHELALIPGTPAEDSDDTEFVEWDADGPLDRPADLRGVMKFGREEGMALARRRLAFSSGLGGLGKSFRRGKKSKKKLDGLDQEPARGKRRGTWCCGRRAKVYAEYTLKAPGDRDAFARELAARAGAWRGEEGVKRRL